MTAVAIIFTGGTIAMRPDAAAGGVVPVLTGAEIVDRTPSLSDIADIRPIDWGLVPASHLRFEQLLDVARLLDESLAAADVAGGVVVQGTDTIEETAFAWDLLVRSDKPVIVTGAMRNSAERDYDGPRNLADAVRCARSPELLGMGTLVVLNGSIVAADAAVKTHTTRFDTFRPRDGDFVGEVVGGEVRVRAGRGSRPRLPVMPDDAPADVPLLTVVSGMDGTLLRLLRPRRPRGVVVAATGAGNTHPDVLAAAQELMADGTVVCLTTRCPSGVVSAAYAFAGGGAEWRRAGAVLAGLDGPKCRVALALGLAAGLGDAELRRILRADAG